MKSIGSKILDGRKIHRTVTVAFLVICLLIGALSFSYYQRLQETVVNESGGYLKEISKQVATNTSRVINDNFSVLGTISMVLENSNVQSYKELQPIVQTQQSYWKYQSIMLIDRGGNAYDAYGNTVMLNSDEYLRQAIVGKERSMSAAQVVNGNECIVFAIPLDNMVIDGTQMYALAASYDLSTFDQILSMSAFNGEGYSTIIRRDGTVVVRSSLTNALQTGYNTLNSLEEAEMDKGDSMTSVKTDIEKGKSGMVGMTYKGVHVYMAYTPLESSEWCTLTFVPVDVVNAKSQMMLKVTLLLCSIVTFSFAALFLALMLSTYRHKKRLEQIAYIDPITGGNTIQRFYEIAQETLEMPSRPEYGLIYVNVEKFKILNEQFGRRICDDMLKAIQVGIARRLEPQECIGRLFADNFCILAKYEGEDALLNRLDSWYQSAALEQEKLGTIWVSPIIDFGVYVISNDSIPFPHMIDRAKLALKETTRELHGKLRCAIYDDAVRQRLFREKQLEDMMEEALEQEEFTVYLQPKYCTQDETIGGAEALVRWQSKSEGMIYPDEFIALFEKNGFITRLDLWVFEQVCKTIRLWLDQGKDPVKISVNCSRVHLRNPDFLEQYREICKKQGVPSTYIEIELTENVVFEDVEHLSKIIDDIHGAGFGCSMDDFGSGYSSLNMIQDIPVDTLKLDKIFFRNGTKDLHRTESVVNSIITMAKSLNMYTVAEGVEEREQVQMLKRLRCDFIQGYYFARPMPILDFEKLAFGAAAADAGETEQK